MACRPDKIGDAGDHRLIHLDLKGAPPKISYYEQIFPLLRQWGATGLLVEYEDMLPYSGDIQHLAAPSAYSATEVAQLLDFAEKAQLIVIPLVQTFGHFEFVLKHEKFRHLREVDEYPMAVCPLHEDSIMVIQMMISQVLQLHPNAKWLHIGADEVYHMGICSRCKQFLNATHHKLDQEEKVSAMNALVKLFSNHINKIVAYTKKCNPNISCIMWDDMLRDLDLPTLQATGLGDCVELMVWYYQPSFNLAQDLWDRYTSVFESVWAASAFKGATGPCACIPDISYHIQNHESWLQIVQQHLHPQCQKFRGFAITGWQSWFALSSYMLGHIDSRFLCGILADNAACHREAIAVQLACGDLRCLHGSQLLCDVLQYHRPYYQLWGHCSFKEAVHRKASDDLNFTDLIPLTHSLLTSGNNFPTCDFPGSAVYKAVFQLMAYKVDYTLFMKNDRIQGWMSNYHIKHNFTNPAHLQHLLPEAEGLLERLQELYNMAHDALSEIFYPDAVEEWLTVNFSNYLKKLSETVEHAQTQISLRARVKDYIPEKVT